MSTATRAGLKLRLHERFGNDIDVSTTYQVHRNMWRLVLYLDASVAISGGTFAVLINDEARTSKVASSAMWTTPNPKDTPGLMPMEWLETDMEIYCKSHMSSPTSCPLAQCIQAVAGARDRLTGITHSDTSLTRTKTKFLSSRN